jgi:hypothetical protein
LPVGGSLSFRFLLQPTVVAIIAIIAGVRDTQAGRPAYFWSIITDAAHRQERLREGWNAIWKVFIVVVVLDVIYEVLVFRTIYPRDRSDGAVHGVEGDALLEPDLEVGVATDEEREVRRVDARVGRRRELNVRARAQPDLASACG